MSMPSSSLSRANWMTDFVKDLPGALFAPRMSSTKMGAVSGLSRVKPPPPIDTYTRRSGFTFFRSLMS